MMRKIALPFLAFLLAAAAPPPLPGQVGEFSEETAVVVVEVPVQVLRGGRPVRGLTAEDFEVLDGRKRREIIGFEVIDLAEPEPGGGRAVPELPVSARRHFLLLFDLSFSDPGAVVRARQAARDLVLEGLHPSDLVAVATYSEARGPRLVLGFTSDRRQVEVALETLGLADPIEQVKDPLAIVLADLGPESGMRSGSVGKGGRPSVDSMVRENIRDLQALSGRVGRDQQKNQVMALTSALEGLAQMMASVDGRKHVVFLSEGFDTSVLLGTEDVQRSMEIADTAARGEYWRVDSDERFGNTATQSELNQMVEAFRRADCTVQSVDISGLEAGSDVRPRASGEDGLFIMANETGGDFIRSFNDLSEAMGEVLERTSVTYVLAFQPPGLELDGSFHRIKVRLKDSPRGTRILHRPGYYAPRPFSEQSPFERQLRTAGMILGGTEGGVIQAEVLAAPFRIEGGPAYVPVLVEVEGNSLLAGSRGDVVPVEIYAYAIDRGGEVRDFFARALGLNVKETGDALRATGLKYWGHLDLPPGDYLARVLVRNAETGVSTLRAVPLSVPAFERAESALLPPLFPEPMGKWLIGREGEEEQRDVPYPFMVGGQPFLPAACPKIGAREEAEVVLMGYNLGDGALAVEAELVDAEGRRVEGGELSVSQRLTGTLGVVQLVGTFRPGRVAAGQYTLMVTVSEPAAGRSHTSSIPIVVQG